MAEGLQGVSPSGRKLGWEDFLLLPDDARYEILDGKLVMTGTPPIRHQRVAANLYDELRGHVREQGLGLVLFAPVAVILDPHTIVVPDLLFVSTDRNAIVGEHAIDGAPDLLVEILSPSTARRDRTEKLRLYSRFGVAHYWIVDADRRELLAFELPSRNVYGPARVLREDERAEMKAPPGFQLDLSRVWA